MSTDRRTIDWYNQNAEGYATHLKTDEGVFHFGLEKPAMYAQLPELKGKSVLSLGCGSGEDSAYLKRQGAVRSVGVDISEKLVEIAKREHPDCEFKVMDMEKLRFDDQSFELVYSSLALHYLKTWQNVLAEAYRVLKPGGMFLFSVDHPFHTALAYGTKDSEKSKLFGLISNIQTDQVKTVGNYFEERELQIEDPMAVTFHRRPLEQIIKEIVNPGFIIKALIEPKPNEKMKELDKRHYYEFSHIPWAMIYKLQKPE